MKLGETSSVGTEKKYEITRYMKLGDMKLGDITYVQNIGNWVGTRKIYEIRRYMKLGDMKLGDIDCRSKCNFFSFAGVAGGSCVGSG